MQALLPCPALPLGRPGELAGRLGNYRPISMLPPFSKLFENVMFNRLTEVLNLHNTLYSKQFGFCNNHSSALALIDLISNISSAINRNESTLGIFLDLSKAFDTINHKILCHKLQHYGIQDTSLSWIKSSNLNCIYLLQKLIVWLISKVHHLASTTLLFSQLKVLDIYSINSFSVATFIYSYHHNLLPCSFRNLFLSSNRVHHYETQLLTSQYRRHFCRTNIKQVSILYRGPTIWNALPITLTSASSIFVFSKKI